MILAASTSLMPGISVSEVPLAVPPPVGAVDQVADSTDVSVGSVVARFETLYSELTSAAAGPR